MTISDIFEINTNATYSRDILQFRQLRQKGNA